MRITRTKIVVLTLLSMWSGGVLADTTSPETRSPSKSEARGMLGRKELTQEEMISEIRTAATTVREMRTKHPEIATSLAGKAKCVGVFPNITKVAIGLGAEYGRGIVTCRTADNSWSTPSFVNVAGGSIGAQIGAKTTDVMMFVVGSKAAQTVANSEFRLGSDVAVIAGSLDKNAAFDFAEGAYVYTKSDGLFVGASLDGARVSVDEEANRRFYGKAIAVSEIFRTSDSTTGAEAIDQLHAALR